MQCTPAIAAFNGIFVWGAASDYKNSDSERIGYVLVGPCVNGQPMSEGDKAGDMCNCVTGLIITSTQGCLCDAGDDSYFVCPESYICANGLCTYPFDSENNLN